MSIILFFSGTEAIAIDAGPGAYSLLGADASFEIGVVIVAGPGTYSLLGSDTVFQITGTVVIEAGAGAYSLIGSDAAFQISGLNSSVSGSAILYQNVADEAVITASSWIAAAPPSTLQNPHVTRRWKGTSGATEYILATWASPQYIDTIGLFGLAAIDDGVEHVMHDHASSRIRISSADPTGLAGDLYDSGNVTGMINESCGCLIKLFSYRIFGSVLRIDLSESGADALMAGRLVVGVRHGFTLNFAYGWSYGYDDLSRKRKSAGGLSFVDRDDRYRVLNLTYETLSSAERYAHVHEIDRLNGVSQDVLFITDVASAEPDRDSIWGLIQDMSPPTQPNSVYFAKTYRIEERR